MSAGLLSFEDIRAEYDLRQIVNSFTPLKRSGRCWMGLCLFHDDTTPSLAVYDDGHFYCHGCKEHGDVVDFLSLQQGRTPGQVVRDLSLGHVGVRDHTRKATTVRATTVSRDDNGDNRDNSREERGEAGNHRIASNNSAIGRDIWRRTIPISGTPADAYLTGRGIALRPPSLGYSLLRADGQAHPCLVAQVQAADGTTQAISRTFLAGDGRGKADIKNSRRALGPVTGGAVHLAEPEDHLILCEGIEDGLSLQEALGIPVWATLGIANLAKVVLPPSVRDITIARDNDAVGIEGAKHAAQHFLHRGYAVRIFGPPPGYKDFNELWMAGQQSDVTDCKAKGERS